MPESRTIQIIIDFVYYNAASLTMPQWHTSHIYTREAMIRIENVNMQDWYVKNLIAENENIK